jgi:peptidoglycan hydrolase CwlO-like protein
MFKWKKLNNLISFAVIASLLAFNFLFFHSVLAADNIFSEQEEMEAKMKELEDKINTYRNQIQINQQKAKSLKTEITILDDEIDRTELEIQRIDLAIRDLNKKIADKESAIREIERQVDLEKTALSELIREISRYDDVSLLEIVLGRDQLSDFLSELHSLENFQEEIQSALKEIYVLKKDSEDEKAILKQDQDEQLSLKFIQEDQKNSLEDNKKNKSTILEQTKGQENLFTQLVNKTQLDIEAVKNRLYLLKGFLTDGQLRFEDAYKFAKFASIYTGVRPAFLLAILSRESELGKNIGRGTWQEDMKPSQRPYYLQICQKLGIDPDKYPVSKKQWYGWGGAMGPAQFMPATWLGYEGRIAEITGNNPPSPWNVKDAFVAAGLYLANKGAGQGGYDIEWKSAMMFLAGTNWSKSYLSFYGDQVMALAKQFQDQIDILERG